MGGSLQREGAAGGRPHLLVWLHLPANDAEGIGRGVVVDLDSAEGLGARASRQPSLVAVIVNHHSGPAGADDRLAAGRGEGRGAGQQGSTAPSLQGPMAFSIWVPWEIRRDRA